MLIFWVCAITEVDAAQCINHFFQRCSLFVEAIIRCADLQILNALDQLVQLLGMGVHHNQNPFVATSPEAT